jgi:hypothetical protein
VSDKKDFKQDFKPYPDGGNLHAVPSKTNPLGKDYFGEIAINLKDMTNVRTEDGLTIFKLAGWKKISKTSGKTYLSLTVDRWIPPVEQAPAPAPSQNKSGFDDMDDDIPF